MGERLGEGEFRNPGIPDKSRAHAQNLFLKQVQELVPRCLEELHGEVLPAFWSHQPTISSTALQCRQPAYVSKLTALSILLRESCPSPAFSTVWEAYAPVRTKIWAWAKRYGLTEAWIVETAAETLDSWTLVRNLQELRWHQISVAQTSPLLESEHVFTFDHPGWEASRQTRADIRAEISEKFASALEDFLDKIEPLVESRGWSRTPPRLGGSNPIRHFDWLVRYQVQGWSNMRTARVCSVSRQTVSSAIEKTARLVDLRLRPPKVGGRPRKALPGRSSDSN